MAHHPSTPAPTLRERTLRLLESAWFERSITALILLNAITLGIETSPLVTAQAGNLLHGFDRLVLAVFGVELLLRGFVHRSRFFRDPWRVFDLLVVGIAMIPAGTAFTVLRSLRVLRVLRLVSLVPSMRGWSAPCSRPCPGWPRSLGSWGWSSMSRR